MTSKLTTRIRRLENKPGDPTDPQENNVLIIYNPAIPGDAELKLAKVMTKDTQTNILIPDNGRN